MVVDAYPGEVFTGTIRYVSPALDAASRSLVVEAELDNPEARLKPGLFATSRIEQATRQNAVLVPASAVRTVAGAARVFVATGEAADRRVEERVVATGQVVGERIEIASGLSAGEQVVVDGLDRVVDGVRIAAR